MFHTEFLYPIFRKKKADHNILFASAVFHMPLAQNYPCTKVAYFGMAYSGIFHHTLPPNSDFFSWILFSPWVWLGTKQATGFKSIWKIRQTMPIPMGNSLRPLLLVARLLPPHCVPMWIQWCLAYIVEACGEKALWASGVSSHKDIIPNRTAPPPPRPHLRLISSLRLHLQIPLHWRLRLQHKDLRKTYSFPVGILIEETSEQLDSCFFVFFLTGSRQLFPMSLYHSAIH